MCFSVVSKSDPIMGIGRGVGGRPRPPLDFKIIGKKRLSFNFEGVKTKFHHVCPPLEKFLGKSPPVPPG